MPRPSLRSSAARARGDTGWLPALAVGSHDVLPRAAARTQTYRRIPPTGRRPEFHEIGAGCLGNDPVGMMERRASSKRYKNVYKHNARTDRFLHQRSLCDPPTHRLWETQITLMIDKVLQANYRTPLSNNVKMLIDVSSDFKTTQLAAGVSVRGCGTPVATTLRGPTAFGSRRSAPGTSHRPERRARSPLAGGAAPRNLPGSSAVNLRHAARDTLLFYTGHRCRHICPVCAKLPAPANDAGFRTVETISVHGEGFSKLRHVHPEMQTTTGIHWLA
ncbi:hypothetical protein Bbelb_156980 [Branchiostoma belcheri]|nr:hypothetical protein Bbelb_156980 [Branchiostoma belcheri]